MSDKKELVYATSAGEGDRSHGKDWKQKEFTKIWMLSLDFHGD